MAAQREHFLLTERLAFGCWREDDLALALKLWGDPRVSAFLGGPFTPEDIRAKLALEMETLRTHNLQYWPVFVRQDGELAGCTGLRQYEEDEHVLELGFHFRPQYWGVGIAHEAAAAVIRFAFETLGVSSLLAGHHPANLASARLILKLGFQFRGEKIYPPTGLLEPEYLLVNPIPAQNRRRWSSPAQKG